MSYNEFKRRSFSKKQREAFIAKHDRICHWCLKRIEEGEGWDIEHIIARELMGGKEADSDANLAPIHRLVCHPAKTALDKRMITKSNHVRAKHNTDGTPSKVRAKIPRPANGGWSKGKTIWAKRKFGA